MTNAQLFLAVALPSLLVIINILATRRLDARVDQLAHRLDGRLDQLVKDVSDIRVALANLRAELYEKFELKSHA
jgi:hypothetical protein